jgi:hypothetical protein
MNLVALHTKLVAAAKNNPPSDKVPYAFEKRILAHIMAAPVPDAWAEWASSLWRAAVPCVLIMCALSGWALMSASPNTPTAAPDFSQQMENTVLAAIDQEQNADSAW